MFFVSFTHAPNGAPMFMVCGLSLSKRAVLSAQSAGFARAIVNVHSADADAVRAELQGDPRLRIPVDVLVGCDDLNACCGPDAGEDDEIAFALGDRVWTSPVLAALALPLKTDAQIALVGGADREGRGAGLARVRRTFAGCNALFAEQAGDALQAMAAAHGELLDGALQRAWTPVRREEDVRAGEDLLLQALRKSADGVISRNINRKLSLGLSRRLVRTHVSPNHVTAVVFAIGVCSGPLAFFGGAYWGFLLGALCYYVSAILDGCDGELSRLKYLGSPLGAWLDTVVDDLVCLSFIVGLYARLALDASHPFWWALGIGAWFFYLATILPRYYVMAVWLGSGDYQKLAAKQRPAAATGLARAVQAVKDVVFRTDFLPFYAFVTAAAHVVPAFAVPFALGSVGSAIDTALTVLSLKRSRGRDASTAP